MLYFVLRLSALYLLFLPPPSLSIDAETTDDTAVYNYVVDDPSISKEQQGKQTPLEHSDITHLSPSYSCIRFFYCIS